MGIQLFIHYTYLLSDGRVWGDKSDKYVALEQLRQSDTHTRTTHVSLTISCLALKGVG